jgi:sirohydrochlorin ferrochelatase
MLNSLRSRPPLDPSPGPEPPPDPTALPDPAALPPPGAPGRWPFLQALRRARPFPLDPWLAAIEAGRLEPLPDLLAALAERLDAPASGRLLRWWLAHPATDPALPERFLRRRDPALAALLRQALAADPAPRLQRALLPLLGHQRQPMDFARLREALRAPLPTPLRAAALEGLSLGLSVWPRAPLRRLLAAVTLDLDPGLAAAALDALARLPDARRDLLPLRQRALAPALAQRLERRLASLPAAPLLLVVHGRAGGVVPAAWQELAAELERRRGAPVALRALTAADPGPPPCGSPLCGLRPLGVVPLLLLPGGHVRHDLPAIVAALGRRGPLRRWPFLGAWPAWQAALAKEAAELAAVGGGRPLLLHHPLEGPLAQRYLQHLERLCAAELRAAPYSSTDSEELALPIRGPVLPLALAANRLTEALTPRLGTAAAAPLLERPRLRSALLAALEALP